MHHGHDGPRRPYCRSFQRTPCGVQERDMEIAALVLFGSIALWFAEELNDNQL
jgi:hypothetical protein